MKTIAVVYGGYSKELVVSEQSASQVFNWIDGSRYQKYKVCITAESWTAEHQGETYSIDRSDFSFHLAGQKQVFDAVVMVIHGTPGEDGKLQGYFEMLGLPVSTCDAFTSALTFNKFACKTFLKEFDIPTAKAVLVRRGEDFNPEAIVEKLGLPIFVKPNNGGSSFGVTKVKETRQLPEAIAKALEEDHEAILEEFIEATELTNGVYTSKGEIRVLPITEIVCKTEFFDFDAKYKGLSDEITPARLSDELTAICQERSRHIYQLLNCKGVVRIDYLLRKDEFYFMEVNTVPGMSGESIIPQQVRAMGKTEMQFFTELIEETSL